MNPYAAHKHRVLDNRADQDADNTPRMPRTHDYTTESFRWGWRCDFGPYLDGQDSARVSGLGPFIRSGDHILVSARTSPGKMGIARFVLSDVRYADDPPDYWKATATFLRWASLDAARWGVSTMHCGHCKRLITEIACHSGDTLFCSWECGESQG